MSILNDPITGKITNDPATGKVLTTPAGGPALCACCGEVFECCTQGDGGDTCNGNKCAECTSIGDGITPTGFAFTLDGVTDCGGTARPMTVSRYPLCFGASNVSGPDDPGDFVANCTFVSAMAKSTEIGGSAWQGYRATFGFSLSLGWTFIVEDQNADTIFFQSGITWTTCCEVDGQVITNSITVCGANQIGKNGSASIWSCACPFRELGEDCVVDPNNPTCVSSASDICLLEVEIAGALFCTPQTCNAGPLGTSLKALSIQGINGTHTLVRRQIVFGSFGTREVYVGSIIDGWTQEEHASAADCVLGTGTPCVSSGDICIRVVVENGIWIRQYQVFGTGNDIVTTGSICTFTTGACSTGKIFLDNNNCKLLMDIQTFFVDGNRLGVAIPTTSSCTCFFSQLNLSGTGSLTANFIGY